MIDKSVLQNECYENNSSNIYRDITALTKVMNASNQQVIHNDVNDRIENVLKKERFRTKLFKLLISSLVTRQQIQNSLHWEENNCFNYKDCSFFGLNIKRVLLLKLFSHFKLSLLLFLFFFFVLFFSLFLVILLFLFFDVNVHFVIFFFEQLLNHFSHRVSACVSFSILGDHIVLFIFDSAQ